MFRSCTSSGSRAVASSSQFQTQPSAFLHTTSALSSQASKRIGLRNKKLNIANTSKRLAEAAKLRPSVVLGTRPGEEETKWKKCELAQVLVDEEKLYQSTAAKTTRFSVPMVREQGPVGTVHLPQHFGHGVGPAEKQLLFEKLPIATVNMSMSTHSMKAHIASRSLNPQPANPLTQEELFDAESKKELQKSNLLAKALDLRNANAGGIAFENRRRIILAFSTPENPYDTGRTEVQVALITYKIRNLWEHLKRAKRDVANRRGLTKLVHQRAKLLRYLKGVSRDRYETLLEQLALDPESVEGELVL
ncbi:30S ribosomal protein S15 [Psilocybe cubensis]|nr:30S ribosomal protein S15 [Psilocybe cubensis]KAH9477832.1 30S ribosomal protein S15 [Psilocybe cubensis]